MAEPEVFFIDDELHIRRAVEQLLLLEGFKVRTFADAASALKLITPEWPGVVLTDINMPGLDGLTLLKQALSLTPTCGDHADRIWRYFDGGAGDA